MELPEFDGFIGAEFGSLSALTAAKDCHKPAVVIFLSPHSQLQATWVNCEYERFPEFISSKTTRRLLEVAVTRDARRDKESLVADVIVTGSRLTSNSLITAGVPSHKVVTVPLGCPPACLSGKPERSGSGVLKFMYSGPISVRKGAHYLMQAWKRLAIRTGAELHFYGSPQLPAPNDNSDGLYFHGHVSADELFRAYRESDFLVFPTLCDGFGLVVGEALAAGLPVLTTENAGAADLIQPYRNGLIVRPADAEALAAGMQWVIENRRVLPEMSEEARKTARDWTWQHFRQAFRKELSAAFLNRWDKALANA
jgi:glycosyltransferase involved in cell wall biosynthesis